MVDGSVHNTALRSVWYKWSYTALKTINRHWNKWIEMPISPSCSWSKLIVYHLSFWVSQMDFSSLERGNSPLPICHECGVWLENPSDIKDSEIYLPSIMGGMLGMPKRSEWAQKCGKKVFCHRKCDDTNHRWAYSSTSWMDSILCIMPSTFCSRLK